MFMTPAMASEPYCAAAPSRSTSTCSIASTGIVFRSVPVAPRLRAPNRRSEEHTSELQSLMRISYAVFCLKKNMITRNTYPKNIHHNYTHNSTTNKLHQTSQQK